MSLVVVIAEDAAGWQSRLKEAGLNDEVLQVEVARSINELADVVIDVIRALGPEPQEISLVVGVGAGGRAAHLLALGGRSAALALVDGLTHRFADPAEVIASRMEWMRSRVAGDLPDVPRIESRSFAERAAAAVGVPTLVVETAASQSTPEVVESVIGAFPKATLVRVDDTDEAAGRVVAWMGA